MEGYEFVPEVRGWAPLTDALPARPAGPWDDNVSVAPVIKRTVCAWCPDFDRNDPANKHTSHTICPSCMADALKAVPAVNYEAK